MDFSGKLFLAVIEEDNTQRALFRVRPLLCEDGNITPEDIDELIDDGFLRVVPDKAEQHTFKERMRELGQLCMINLKDIPPDFNKVRLNNNYAPNRGENNRFVIYSDAIQSLGNIEIFEVISDPKLIKPNTSAYYLRNGGHIQGPYDSISSNVLDAVSCIAPDNHRLFSVAMPDEREKLFYWPQPRVHILPEKNEVNVLEKLSEENIVQEDENSLSAKERIDEIQASLKPLLKTEQQEKELPQMQNHVVQPKKLSGTTIKFINQRGETSRSESLSLPSIVDRAVRQGRPEEPSASLQNAGALQWVENPAEQFRGALQFLWNDSQTKQVVINDFLAMPGATQALSDTVCGKGKSSMQALLRQQLNQLEAERLALVIELDHIRDNRVDLLKTALRDGGKHTDELLKKQSELEAVIQKLSLQCNELSLKREELLTDVNSSLYTGHFVGPAFGADCSFEKAVKLITEALKKAGFAPSKNDAVNLLIFALISPKFNLRTDHLADAKLAATLISNAIGASLINDHQAENLYILPGGDAPIFIAVKAGPEGYVSDKKLDAFKRILLTDRKKVFWPSVFLPVTSGFSIQYPSPSGIIIKEQQLKNYLSEVSRDIPEDALKLLEKAEMSFKRTLPLDLKREMMTYLTCAQSLLEGGAAASIDYAFACYLIPFALENGLDTEPLRSLCEGLPLASALL